MPYVAALNSRLSSDSTHCREETDGWLGEIWATSSATPAGPSKTRVPQNISRDFKLCIMAQVTHSKLCKLCILTDLMNLLILENLMILVKLLVFWG